MRFHITTVLAVALSVGCQKSEPPGAKGDDEKAQKATSGGVETKPKKTEDQNLPPLESIPTEDDFSDAAEKEINEGTDLDKELDALEKEINE